ncbi:type IV secretion system protein virB10-like isoform X2 [Osmia bicornis bicornis]|uniref:type IV secretion system protein virB10-like isoform X2 n=1 Tax=Osmia bicornis bicornis TaxID=1437191 RepID=UPI001EAEFE13|nr:type IV secretion system protein virB10-like isoform X2 [Osmia bicornis bicornis]
MNSSRQVHREEPFCMEPKIRRRPFRYKRIFASLANRDESSKNCGCKHECEVQADAPVHHQLQLPVLLLPPLIPAPSVLLLPPPPPSPPSPPPPPPPPPTSSSLVLLPLAEVRRAVHLVAVDTSYRTVVVSRRAGHTTSCSRSPLLLPLFIEHKD